MRLNLQQLQAAFMAAITHDEPQFREEVMEQGNVTKDTRIAIYHNAYRARLRETLDNDHEVLGTYLGDEWFELMVSGYCKAYPSHYRSLRDYGQHLPQFLAETAPFKSHALIAELARFERALLFAFDAAECERDGLLTMQNLAPDDWPELRFQLHPSVQPFHSQWNCVEVWQAIKQKKRPPAPKQLTRHWLIWRNNDRLTEFQSLDKAQWAFLQSVVNGECFAGICEQSLAFMSEEEVSQFAVDTLIKWLQTGVIARLKIEAQLSSAV